MLSSIFAKAKKFSLIAATFFIATNLTAFAADDAGDNHSTWSLTVRLILTVVVIAAAKAALIFWRRVTIPLNHSLPLAWWRSALRRAGLLFLYGGSAIILLDFFLPSEYLPSPRLTRFYLPFIATVALVFVYDFVPTLMRLFKRKMRQRQINPDPTLLELLRRIIRIAAVLVYVIYMYREISGSSFTTLLAGLGLGGMAIALAATDSLKNFFAFLVIVFSKPFTIGDRVVIGDNDGIVEDIGLRNLRLRLTNDDRRVCLPNVSAIDGAVKNVSARKFFHRSDILRLSLDTPPEKICTALAIVREILSIHEVQSGDFHPQAKFTQITGSAYEITFDYRVFGVSATTFATCNENVNFAILERFRDDGILLAGQTAAGGIKN